MSPIHVYSLKLIAGALLLFAMHWAGRAEGRRSAKSADQRLAALRHSRNDALDDLGRLSGMLEASRKLSAKEQRSRIDWQRKHYDLRSAMQATLDKEAQPNRPILPPSL